MDARDERLHAREYEWMLGGGPLERTFADCTYIIVGILKANTYLLQRHFKKVHIRNCSFIYKKVKMKGGLEWMKKYMNDLARSFNGNHFSSY